MKKGIKVLHKKCNPELAQDKSLPYTAYLVQYTEDGELSYDICTCSKQVELFDFYWDTYRTNFLRFDQTEGRVNPKFWNPQVEDKK